MDITETQQRKAADKRAKNYSSLSKWADTAFYLSLHIFHYISLIITPQVPTATAEQYPVVFLTKFETLILCDCVKKAFQKKWTAVKDCVPM